MNSDVVSFASLAPVFPELLLAIAAIVLLLLGVTFKTREQSAAYTVAAIVLLLGVAGWVLLRPADGVIFNGGFISDDFARYMKVLVLVGSAFALLLSISTAKQNGLDKFEYAVLVMLATLGMMVMVSANDLISLYVGLELQSLALYVVAAINRDNAKATEAGLKYFVLGALSSGMLLYGASLVYGFTGQTQLDEITRVIAMGDALDRADLRHGVPARRHRLQDFRRAVPHVDARRLRRRPDPGHRLLRLGAEGRGDGAPRPRRHRQL